MTPDALAILNRDYEFLRFEYHFTPDYALLRELLRLGGGWLTSWFLWVWSCDVPDMIYRKRAAVENIDEDIDEDTTYVTWLPPDKVNA